MQKPHPGRKHRRYNAGGFLKGYGRWVGRHKSTRKDAARAERRKAKNDLRD